MIWRKLLTCLQAWSYQCGYQRKNTVVFFHIIYSFQFVYCVNNVLLYLVFIAHQVWANSQLLWPKQDLVLSLSVAGFLFRQVNEDLWIFLSLVIHSGTDNASPIITMLWAAADCTWTWPSPALERSLSMHSRPPQHVHSLLECRTCFLPVPVDFLHSPDYSSQLKTA